MKVLFVGDVVGRVGRRLLDRLLPRLIDRHGVDLVVANGENAASGFGLTRDVVRELHSAGVDVVTTGNHVWDKKEVVPALGDLPNVLRPANYPGDAPGRGWGLFETAAGVPVGVVNLEGRVFMSQLDCPFRAADAIVEELRRRTPVILVDFHAEATSEKVAMGHYLDGRVSLVVGTHTHVPTADARVLPGGTAFQTDAGMTGARDSVIGIRKELAIEKFLSQRPVKFDVAKKDPWLNGLVCDIDETTGKARSIVSVLEPGEPA